MPIDEPATASTPHKERLTNEQVFELSNKMNMILAKAKSVINSTYIAPSVASTESSTVLKVQESAKLLPTLQVNSGSCGAEPSATNFIEEKRIEAPSTVAVMSAAATVTPSKKPLFDKLALSALKQKLKPSASQPADACVSKATLSLLFDSVAIECKIAFDASTAPSFCAFNSLHPQVLEYALVVELLHAFLGVSGEIITVQEMGRVHKFLIADGVGQSFQQQISAVLNFSCVVKSLRECANIVRKNLVVFGRVVGDFFANIDKYIADFYAKLADFEKAFWDGTKSLLSFCSLIDSFKSLFELFLNFSHIILNQFSLSRQGCIVRNDEISSIESHSHKRLIAGGNLINFLYENSLKYRGDSIVFSGLNVVLQSAIQCYNAIVLEAVISGCWADKTGIDYMIVRKKNYNPLTDEEMSNITIDKNNIPYHLVEYSEKLLKISKFHQIITKNKKNWKATRLQTEDVFSEEVSWQKSNFDNQSIQKVIDSVFQITNRKVYRFLVEKMQLASHLRLFVDFFLMRKSGFFQQFIDSIAPFMKAQTSDICLAKITSAFEACLNCPFAEKHMRIFFNPSFYVTQLMEIINLSSENTISPFSKFKELNLKMIDSLTIDYLAEYPLNMIFTPKIVTKYQLVFRHLLYVFSLQKKLSSLCNRKISLNSKFYFIRQRMISFLQSIRYYFLCEVIEPNWTSFESNVILDENCQSLEEFIRLHEDYVDNLLKELLLTDQKLLKLYSNVVLAINTAIAAYNENSQSSQLQARESILDEFMLNLKVLIDALYFNSATDAERHLANLLCRIDFNDFYSKYFCIKDVAAKNEK